MNCGEIPLPLAVSPDASASPFSVHELTCGSELGRSEGTRCGPVGEGNALVVMLLKVQILVCAVSFLTSLSHPPPPPPPHHSPPLPSLLPASILHRHSFCCQDGSPRAHHYVVEMLRFMSLKYTNRACPLFFLFLFFCSVLVSVSVFMVLSTVFHSKNSDNSPLSHSVPPVLYFCLIDTFIHISLYECLPRPRYYP